MNDHGSGTRKGFTIVELLVVLGIIAVLMGIIFTAVAGLRGTGELTKSKSNLRQIHTWMELYSGGNNGAVLPSQFDYSDEQSEEHPVRVRSFGSYSGDGASREWVACNPQYAGTWADILWYENELNESYGLVGFQIPGISASNDNSGDYRSFKYEAPDRDLYTTQLVTDENPFRSSTVNTYNFPRWYADGSLTPDDDPQNDGSGVPKPYGTGAWERDLPGFFAANNFFDARSERDRTGSGSTIDRTYTSGQIHKPARSLYLIDSIAGETIDPLPEPYFNESRDAFMVDGSQSATNSTCEVDFRYSGGCLMLFMDGAQSLEGQWYDLDELQGTTRNVRVTNLDRRNP